jgi:catechol 2,3-dioxygenase-like lactoylglutathione lyase family enzyme
MPGGSASASTLPRVPEQCGYANLLPLARRVLLGLAAALLLSSSAPAGAGALVQAVDSITLTVSDLERALPSYKEVLNFEKVSDVEVAGEGYEHLAGTFGLRMRVVRLRLGDEHIELMQVLAPEGRPIPADSRSNDRWFQHIAMITRDMDRAYGWLRRHKVRHASPGPQCLPDWNPDAGGIEAFYFKDPDSNHLEVLEFPEGKGDPKWHRPGDELFLGIDHTAVVVGDTDSSLAFYRVLWASKLRAMARSR